MQILASSFPAEHQQTPDVDNLRVRSSTGDSAMLETTTAADVQRHEGSEPEHAVSAQHSAAATNSAKAGTSGVHDRGLLLIGLFKLSKSIFFFCVGLGALHLVHKDLGDELMRLTMALHRDPEGRLVTLLMNKVDLVDAHRLRQVGFFSFAYSVLCLIEGYGLVMEKPWAEYLTLTLTIMFLPWELYELAVHPSWGRLALLAINLLVLGYLLWLLRRKRDTQTAAAV